nr:serpin-ZX-like [Ipomoea batatas]
MTKDHEFHLLNGSSIQVPFMSNYVKQYVKAFSGFKVLKLSYNRGNDYKKRRSFSMYFFLPDAMDGLPSLLDKASSESEFLERHLPTHMVSVGKFLIPKFQISFQFEGSRVLKELGVVAPFNPTGGGLTEMVDSSEGSELYVSKILHGSFVEVNVGGTEAAEANMDVNSRSITNQVNLSLKLAKHVFSTQAKGDSNLVFSPLSINVILSLIAAGSNPPTRDELLSFLKSDSIDDLNTFYSQIVDNIRTDDSLTGGPCLSVANGLWIDRTLPFKPSFKHVVDSVYKAASESVDFRNKASEVVDQVNSWAEKETKGLINNLLPPSAIDDTTRLIYASALYFKGDWSKKFNESMTQDHEFHLLNGSSIQVPFMRTCVKQYVKAFSGFKVLKLSYNRGNDNKKRRSFSMYFFLPDAMDGLPSLLEKASSESEFLERHLPTKLVSVGKFRIPKFQISFQFEVSRVLGELGVKAPFNPRGGGLTEMVDSPEGSELYVSKILQKSFIEVNEGGTEAAAVSVSLMAVGAGFRIEKEDKTDFVADHPFLFAIREDFSGAILFVGTVLHPQYNSKNLPSKPTPALLAPGVISEYPPRPSVGLESMGPFRSWKQSWNQSVRSFVGGSENKEFLESDFAAEIERLFMSLPDTKKMGV